jgi:hypothetical protein
MIISRRTAFAAIPLSILFVSSLQAAPKRHVRHERHERHERHAAATGSWSGTWSGSWGGSQPTSITIAGNRVVSYTYQGASTPVTKSRVTLKSVTYEGQGTTVTMTRTGATTASAKLHSQQGEGTAELTRQ